MHQRPQLESKEAGRDADQGVSHCLLLRLGLPGDVQALGLAQHVDAGAQAGATAVQEVHHVGAPPGTLSVSHAPAGDAGAPLQNIASSLRCFLSAL